MRAIANGVDLPIAQRKRKDTARATLVRHSPERRDRNRANMRESKERERKKKRDGGLSHEQSTATADGTRQCVFRSLFLF